MHKSPKKLREMKRAERERLRKILLDDAIQVYKCVRSPEKRVVDMTK